MANIIKTTSEAVNRMLDETRRAQEQEMDASLKAFEQMAKGQAAGFDIGGELPTIKREAAAIGERELKLYGAYGDAFFDAKPSAELLGKEKKRLEGRSNDADEIAILEAGLCKKFGITPPYPWPNRRGDRGETGEQLLMIGETVNDRRNPKIWGLRSEDFTRHAHIGGPSGSGKRIPLDTLILSEQGWRKLSSLNAGDKIYTREGVLTTIEWMSDISEDVVWEITFEDGRQALGHEGHQWIVFDKIEKREHVWETWELKEHFEKEPTRYAFPNCAPIQWGQISAHIGDEEYLPVEEREELLCRTADIRMQDYVSQSSLIVTCKNPKDISLIRQLVLSLGHIVKVEADKVEIIKAQYTNVVGVRKTDETTQMRCIGVADTTHSYIMQDYIITHNSTLLNAMCVEQCWYWRGGLLMEPHGDLAMSVLRTAPPYRIHDILYLNVLDPQASPGFNPLELPLDASESERAEAVGAVTALIAKHFNMESGMVKLMKMLTNALNALSYVPGATLLEIMDVYNNEDIRNTVLSFVPDGPQKEAMSELFENAKADDLGSLDNRISRFTTNRYMKHLFGQSRTTIDFFDLMNKGYFIICPVSKGGTQDDTFLKFYGSYIVSEIYKSALLRDSIPEMDRVNFAMVLDEFQNFISDDIEGILAEARKYGLQLCLANQILAQLPPKSVRPAVLQNCATKLYYAQQVEDAPIIAKTLGHGLKAEDLMNVPKYHIMAAPLIKGAYVRPFISKVFPPITPNKELSNIVSELIAENTRKKYMKDRDEIDNEIADRKERLASGNKQAVVDLVTKKNK